MLKKIVMALLALTLTADEQQSRHDRHKHDFDYLLGDWEFSAVSEQYGKFGGYWSAVKLADGQILDEYRVVGDKGETYYVSTTVRNYNKVRDQWELVGLEPGAGLTEMGTGRRVGEEMHIEQRFDVITDKPSLWRIRYYDIRPDSFSWSGDRSLDDGKTWSKAFLQIKARRIGPPRYLGQLAPARGETK